MGFGTLNIWLPDLKNSLHDGVKLWRTLKLLKETSFCVNELESECITARLQRRALHFYSCQYMYLYIFFNFTLIWDNDFIMIWKLKTNKQTIMSDRNVQEEPNNVQGVQTITIKVNRKHYKV